MPEAVSLPQYTPSPRELDDVELLRMGVLAPLHGFEGPDSDITLTAPTTAVDAARDLGGLEITDPEGVPLAVVTIDETYSVASASGTDDGMTGVVGEVRALPGIIRRAFGDRYRPPSTSRTKGSPRTVTVPVDSALTAEDLSTLSATLGDRPVLFLVLTGAGTPRGLSAHGLIRATDTAAATFPDARVIAVPAAARDHESGDLTFRRHVAAAYAPGPDLFWPTSEGSLSADIAAVVECERPTGVDQGLVVFFTGLSGSGKSTLSHALRDRLLESGGRSVSLLDGDRVRRNLSKGLTFSREDRETNIERIGWVGAEIARHGGLAICSPIAPFDRTRKVARAMADDVGAAFVLVHVATPLDECERRDRKHLYAKARRGEVKDFTGISSPYEVPADAEIAIDTTSRSVEEVLAEILAYLVDRGWLPQDVHDAVSLGAP